MSMWRIALVVSVAFVVVVPTIVRAATTTSVVRIPTRPGVTQPILYVHPDAPVANIVFLPGTNGILGIENDGTMTTIAGACGPVARNRDAYAARGFAVALVDQASDGSIRQYADILEVVRYMRGRDNVPTWLVGISASTNAALNFAIDLPSGEPLGVIFASPVAPDTSRAPLIKRPALVIYHPADSESVPYVNGLFATLGAPVKSLVDLSGGTNSGCGYHLFAGLDAEFVAETASFIDKYNPTLTPPPATLDLNQYGLTGSWYEPATNGQGVEVQIFPDLIAPGTGRVQVSWFTYDTSTAGGPERQRWYTMGGNVATGAASVALPIYQNVGGNFNALPITNSTQVGTATLRFADCEHATLDYTFTDGSNRSGTLDLMRLTKNVTCVASGARPVNADFAFSGNWYDPATSGQGLTIDVNPGSGTVFVAWYTYAPTGVGAGVAGQRWYTAQPTSFTPGARSIPLTIYETTGGVFDRAAIPTPQTVAVGTGTLAFQSCSAATWSFAFTGGSSSGSSGTIALKRVGPVPKGCM